jgi:hypothetical protein
MTAAVKGLSARDAAIVNMTQAGISGPAVAAQFGVTVRTVQRARSRAGVCKPPPARFTDDEIKLAERLFEDGASYGESHAPLAASHQSSCAGSPTEAPGPAAQAAT